MNKRSPGKTVINSAESSELHGELFSVIIHDLGAISTALALRAEALVHVLPAADCTALTALAGQISDMKRSLRIAHGPRSVETLLSPERRTASDEWWRIMGRFVQATVPRGVSIQLRTSTAWLTPQQANGLTLIWLAACKDVSEAARIIPNAIRIDIVSDSDGQQGFSMVAQLQSGLETVRSGDASNTGNTTRTASRWFRYASRVARANDLEMTWWHDENNTTRWICKSR